MDLKVYADQHGRQEGTEGRVHTGQLLYTIDALEAEHKAELLAAEAAAYNETGAPD